MSAAQAEMQDELEDAKRNAPWVDITQGMELSEKLEHKLSSGGKRNSSTLLWVTNSWSGDFYSFCRYVENVFVKL